jgi:hypothetical protein
MKIDVAIRALKKLETKCNILHDYLSDHVWCVFDRYLKITGGCCNYPESWYLSGGYIEIEGRCGCMGSYDDVYFSLPIEMVLNPDKYLQELQDKLDAESKAKQLSDKTRQEKEERDKLTELVHKYGYL